MKELLNLPVVLISVAALLGAGCGGASAGQPSEAAEERIARRVTEALAQREARDRQAMRDRIEQLVRERDALAAEVEGGGRVDPDPEAVERIRVPAAGAARGGSEPLVTIVAFSEFQCPFCARAQPTIAEIFRRYGESDVRLVFRHNPLPFHNNAFEAAEAAMEARAQRGERGFWDMHDLLFANQRALERADLERYAQQLGLDLVRFRDALDRDVHGPAIRQDMAVAAQVGARGTPMFFLNGRLLSGAQPINEFVTVIDQEIANARATLARGTPRGRLYAALQRGALPSIPDEPPAPPAPPSPGGGTVRQVPDPNAVYRVPVAGSAARGPADALVTIVVFSEFQCPFCARVVPTLDQLVQQYGADLRVVFRHNPLPFHQNAVPAAHAAAEARAQRGDAGFWQMHDLLFANQRALDAADLERYAQQIGLDLARFRAAMAAGTHRAAVQADMDYAQQIGARGTPGFFINGRQLRGAQPIDAFRTLIDEQLRTARARVAAGTPRAQVYDALTASGATSAQTIAQAVQGGAGPPDPDVVYAIPVPARTPRRGPATAPVTIQIFSDFQCPFCSRSVPTIDQLITQYGAQLQVVWRNYPLPFHQDAELAAEAAMEVYTQQGDAAFWRFHDLLFANQHALERADLERYAQQVGRINMGRFKRALDRHAQRARVQSDMTAVQTAGARIGTPSFFINGRLVQGAQPLDVFQRAIDRALAESRAPAPPPAPTPTPAP